jgi:hypothetical protein
MQRQEITYLYLNNDADSFFLELLTKYFKLVEHFKLSIIRAEESLIQAGTLP